MEIRGIRRDTWSFHLISCILSAKYLKWSKHLKHFIWNQQWSFWIIITSMSMEIMPSEYWEPALTQWPPRGFRDTQITLYNEYRSYHLSQWSFTSSIMTSSNGNIFRVFDLCEGNHRSRHKGHCRGALMFSLIAPGQTVGQTFDTPVIWNAIAFIMASL